jgi:ankyrin repeat protein
LEKPVVDPNFLIPVFVNLSDLEGPANDMVEKAFLQNGLTQMDLETLKAHKVDRFFFIIDGVYEFPVPMNLLDPCPTSKILLTARTELLLSFGNNSYQQYFTLNKDEKHLEYYIRPFTIDQQNDCFQKLMIKNNLKNEWEEALNILEEIRESEGGSSIFSNPFMLTMIIEYLYDVLLEQRRMGIYNTKITRNAIYTHYITNGLLEISFKWERLQVSYNRIPFFLMNIDHYFEKLKMLAKLVAGNMFMKNSQLIDCLKEEFHIPVDSLQEFPNENWKSFVLDMRMIALVLSERITSLILKCIGGNIFVFQHPCLYDYFAAKVLLEELQLGKTKDESSHTIPHLHETAFFNQQSLQKQDSILQVLVEMIEDQLLVERSATIIHTLWQIIDQSKNTLSFAIAAGNALTLLVHCKISFKERDLSAVWISGAIVNDHIFEKVDFTDAHFLSTSWDRVNLQDCNFTNCIFQDNNFKERASLTSLTVGSIFRIHVLRKYHIVIASGNYPGLVVWQYGQRIYSNPELLGCQLMISPNQLWIACKLKEQVWLYSVKNNRIVYHMINVQTVSHVRNNGLIYYKEDEAYFLYYKERVKDPRKIYNTFDDTPEITELSLKLNKKVKEIASCIELKDGLEACLYRDDVGWSMIGLYSLTINHGKKNFFSLYEESRSTKKNTITIENSKTFNYVMMAGIFQTPFFLVSNITHVIYGFDGRTLQMLPNLEHLANYPADGFIVSPKGKFLLIKHKKTVHIFSIISNEEHPTHPVTINYLYTMENIQNKITTEQFSIDEKYIVWGLVGQVIVTKTTENLIVQEVYLRNKVIRVTMVAFLMTPEYVEEGHNVASIDTYQDQKFLGNAVEAQIIVLQDISSEVLRLKVDIDEQYENTVAIKQQRIKHAKENKVKVTASSSSATAAMNLSHTISNELNNYVSIMEVEVATEVSTKEEARIVDALTSVDKSEKHNEIRAMGSIFVGAQFIDQDGNINQEDINILKERGGIFDEEFTLIAKYKSSIDQLEKEDIILLAASYRYRQFFESKDVIWDQEASVFERNNNDSLIHFVVRQERNDGDYEDYFRFLIHTVKLPFDSGNKHLITPLYIAARKGHLKTCTVFIEVNANVNQSAIRGYTPLYVAALEGHADVCKLLLDANAEVDKHTDDGYFPLYIAAQEGHDEVCRLLIQYGANVTKADKDGFTSLFLACQCGLTRIIRILIEEGHANVNQCTNLGFSPLYVASEDGSIETMELLIKSGAQVNLASNDGSTPILTAAQHGRIEATRLLIAHGANVNTADDQGFSPLHLAASNNGRDEICRLLVEAGAEVNESNKDEVTPLYVASENGHEVICKYLLEQGADINRPTGDDCTPLYIATYIGHTEIVQLFLHTKGIEVNKLNGNGYSPLYSAARNGHEAIVDMLIEHGANALQEDNVGDTPLYIASMYGHAAACSKLINAGGEVGKIGRDGFFPLYVSAQNGHTDVCRLLLSHGANPNQLRTGGVSALYAASQNGHFGVCEVLLLAGANANFARQGSSSFYTAAKNGHLDICKLLVEYNADYNVVTASGHTSLYIAVENNHPEVCKYLIEKGVNVNLTTSNERFFALYRASESGYEDVCRVLLEGGADVNYTIQEGFSSLYIAAQRGFANICTLLLDYGANIHHLVTSSSYCPLYVAVDSHREETCRFLIDRMNFIPQNCIQLGIRKFGATYEIVKLMREINNNDIF